MSAQNINEVGSTFEEEFLKIINSIAEKYPLRYQKEIISPNRQRCFEFFQRLVIRAEEIQKIEFEMHIWDQLRERRPMKDIQLEFVNKTESFHQQVYACVSSFIKLLSYLAPKEFKDEMPIKRNSKFLKFLNEKIDARREVEILEKSSNEYRVKYIDHISQAPSHDWMTHSGPDGKAYVIYFEGRESGSIIDLTEYLNSPIRILSPFSATLFFVPPHQSDVLSSYITIVLETLKLIISSNHGANQTI